MKIMHHINYEVTCVIAMTSIHMHAQRRRIQEDTLTAALGQPAMHAREK